MTRPNVITRGTDTTDDAVTNPTTHIATTATTVTAEEGPVMSPPADSADSKDGTDSVALESWRAGELAHTLGVLEDWLLHTDDVVLDDLARFAFRACWSPPRAVAHLIDELGNYSVWLRRAHQTTPPTTRKNP